MDNETKQIFEQLIEAINNNRVDSSQLVEVVNSPDWWMIILTTINIVAFILVAYAQLKQQKYQTKLQEQQVRAQEYEVRKRLYLLLTNANRAIDNFIEELDWLLWQPWHNSNEGGLNRKKAHIDKLFNDLSDSYVDYELKLSKDTFNKDGYLNILNLMSRVLQHTIDSLENGEAHLSYGHQTIYNVNGDMVEGEIRHICSHFKEGLMLNALYQTLKQFIELRKKVRCDNSLLEDIKAKCKID